MSEKIEPALTPEEWTPLPDGSFGVVCDDETVVDVILDACVGFEEDGETAIHGTGLRIADTAIIVEADDLAAVIALANAALPDSDPRKITRERVEDIRNALGADETWTGTSEQTFARIQQFLNALEAYLPPTDTQ